MGQPHLGGNGTGLTEVLGKEDSTVKIRAPALNTATDGNTIAVFTLNMIASTGGPTTAAQHGWAILKDSTGATFWVPVWK